MPTLLISVRFDDGRYHGSGEWPPSPARLLQALVAGAARGEDLSKTAIEAFEWLDKSVAAGFEIGGYINGDRDLDNLRTDARFKRFLSTANDQYKYKDKKEKHEN